MVIKNDFFKERREVNNFLSDNKNVFKVTYFKEYGKYYTEEFYELTHDYNSSVYGFIDKFKEFCRDYKGMFAVIEFNDEHPTGYPFMVLASERM